MAIEKEILERLDDRAIDAYGRIRADLSSEGKSSAPWI